MTGESLPPLREVLARHGLMATKALGQHFLLDLNLTARIARAAGDLSTGTCVEVGPGPGGLTRALLDEGAAHVVAIEKDKRCREILEELRGAYPGRLETIEADALTIDASRIGTTPRRIVANLPYNVGTELLLGWLSVISDFDVLVLMFQSEVAARLTAPPATKAYGRLSVLTQWLCDVEQLFHVNPRAFTPPPAVNSTVVRLTPRPQPLAPARRETLERVTAAAFGQRRKMLRQSLKSLGIDGEALCRAAGIDPTARAEVLSVQDFCTLARSVDER